MQAFAGLALAAALLLVAAAAPKLVAPTSTVVALRGVGLAWVGARTARALTGLELAAGVGAIVIGGRVTDGIVALLYLGFSGFLVLALRSPGTSCGCTGRDDTPPTVAHLLMTVVLAVGTAAATVAGGRTGLLAVSRAGNSSELVVLAGLAMLAAWLGWAILTVPIGLPGDRRAI